MSGPGFDAALPAPHSDRWREAYSVGDGESPRLASYSPPGGEAIPFVLGGFRFSGGQSKDTAEYPFGGLWSNEYLNEKPQKLSVDGFLRGADYIARRRALVEALRVRTDDDSPGVLDLPFWGRFPVVVGDRYEVSEISDEQGQCRISIPFTRAGVGVEERASVSPPEDIGAAGEELTAAAVDNFESTLDSRRLDLGTLRAGFGQVTNALLAVTGRIMGPRRILDAMTASALGILSLVNQAVRAPRLLALATFNSANAIGGGVAEIRNGALLYGRGFGNPHASGGSPRGGGPSLPPPDNERNALLLFLSAESFALPGEAATVSQAATRAAVENLYRTTAFLAAAGIVADMDSLTREKAAGYWRLLERLAGSVDSENPSVHGALGNALAVLSRKLSARGLGAETTRDIPNAVPLLHLAHYLGCDEDALRRLNRIADSFVVEGEVIYV